MTNGRPPRNTIAPPPPRKRFRVVLQLRAFLDERGRNGERWSPVMVFASDADDAQAQALMRFGGHAPRLLSVEAV